MQPRTTIQILRGKGSYALCHENVRVQMAAEVENLNGAAVRAIHFKVRYHPSADCALLGIETFALYFVPQGIHMVNTFLNSVFPLGCLFPTYPPK